MSAFGMSGTNSHVIVSMPDTVSAPERGPECGEV
ncbi:polyketide synthase [Mycobacterium tuberculosis]|uniref:Polyketide synthase n=1 Tax=Mycobacterium tuberculosis TaxID=1773 RepID=A0A916PAE8_MYCTX|nr:polyketide synthase [Mycobacterium tuberculosis]CPB74365.1 polyketide synthase [Mycobacterium tuberculosis]CPC08727.1 polyketide synthase [Mycobacterium tuberculosis]